MHELGAVYPSDGTLQVMDVGSTAANVGFEAMERKRMVRKEGSSVRLVGKGWGGRGRGTSCVPEGWLFEDTTTTKEGLRSDASIGTWPCIILPKHVDEMA